MKIKINYRLVNSQETMELNLLPTEYFDFPGEGETGYSINSISKFIFPYEYINYELQDIVFVNLNIEDSKSYARREMFFGIKAKIQLTI
ncbi:hypothetical protein [Ferruginibacter sp.]|nr:hypothetical protein [Ferruginibacter sp.]